MEAVNKTPLDFGLKVRNSDTGILITLVATQSAETMFFKGFFFVAQAGVHFNKR